MSAKKVKHKANFHKSRKQLRKEERKNKKIRRNEYYTNRRKPGQFVLLKKENNNSDSAEIKQLKNVKKPQEKNNGKAKIFAKKKPVVEEDRDKEKREQLKLQKEMKKQRNKQLLQANMEEDRNIKRLEKQLKLNKRKSKGVPASFSKDGLDYLLEVCDPENLKTSALAEQQLAEVNDEFAEDLELMTDRNKNRSNEDDDDDLSNEEFFGDSESDEEEESEMSENKSRKRSVRDDEGGNSSEDEDDTTARKKKRKTSIGADFSDDGENSDVDTEDGSSSEDEDSVTERSDRSKKRKTSVDSDLSEDVDFNGENSDVECPEEEEETDNGTWEDIYGRLRTKDGSIIEKSGKYVPPAARILQEDASSNKARNQKLERLKRQLKGLINRLAESNMHSIATQIEELYMNNSRNDMNTTITNLVLDALASNILTPERLLMEHILLIVILHANVGTEVGAHFLQTVIKQFDENVNITRNIENKKLDNIVIILSQLYNFKLFDSKLIYEVIDKLVDSFGEKDVECILHILRNVGFGLRKDNPLALKNLILTLQKKASSVSDEMKDNSRVKFMLDVLLAIKNNNVTKIPNYDTSYSEHLKKIMKGFIRKGNYVTQLNISLEDLLKAEEKGKWWVVGSAWTGNVESENTSKNTERHNSFSQKLLDLAVKQRMNTDTRKNIFCIIMSAEDYLDAFEKLLRLSLKNQQEREIIHVILHCCLQEKSYNPYYATLAQKFCEYDRKYQMTIKYSIWDKLKALKDHSATQISHLAKLLGHLFIEKGLPISTLKIVQFSELDKVTLRFIRQILLGILLHDDVDVCKSVFEKVGQSDKLKMFRESLRLFLYHFLLRNLDSQGVSDRKEFLQQRVKVVERLLTGRETKIR